MYKADPANLTDETVTRFDMEIRTILKRYPRCVIAAALFPQAGEASSTSSFDPFGEWCSPTGIYGTNQLEGEPEVMAAMSAYLQVIALKGMHHEAKRSPVGRDEFLSMARLQREHMVAELVRQMTENKEGESC